MSDTNILSAINALEYSSVRSVTVAEFVVKNGSIKPFLTSPREQNFSVFGITRQMYENYVMQLLALYFSSIQLSSAVTDEDLKQSRNLFYSSLKFLVHSILNDSFKITEVFPSISIRDEFESQCIAIVGESTCIRPDRYNAVPKSLLDFTSWLEHYFCVHASRIAIIPLCERQRLDSISKLNSRVSRLTNTESSALQDLQNAKFSLDNLKKQNPDSRKIPAKEKALRHLQDDFSSIHQNRKSANEKLSALLRQGIQVSSYQDSVSNSPVVKFHNMKDTLYIYKGLIKCTREKHPVISVNANIPTASGQTVSLNVNYCSLCRQFHLSYDEYTYYLSQYRTLLTKVQFLSESGSKTVSSFLSEESPLKLCGYSVAQDKGLTSSERKNLLALLIDNKIVSKSDVIQYLNWFIQTNGQRHGNDLAKEKWKDDLQFVRNFRSDSQKSYTILNIEPYSHP